jgi:hypothetical protein
MTVISDLRDYLREYWTHVSRSFGRKALLASVVWLAGMFAPLGIKTLVTLPEWAAMTWMISWAALGYLFAPYGIWKAQRKKIEELQDRAQSTRISK